MEVGALEAEDHLDLGDILGLVVVDFDGVV